MYRSVFYVVFFNFPVEFFMMACLIEIIVGRKRKSLVLLMCLMWFKPHTFAM